MSLTSTAGLFIDDAGAFIARLRDPKAVRIASEATEISPRGGCRGAGPALRSSRASA
jgi:hypothetical protein